MDVHQFALSPLLLGFRGATPPRWLLEALADGLGGVVLFGSNVGDGRDVARLTRELRAAAGRDIVVALDEEGGDVTRLDTQRGSASPGAAALGHLDDPTATEDVHAAVAARLLEAGVTLNLAPVADVNVDPRNPVIGVRSFGADPAGVARHVAAAVRGLQRQGVAACVKHFPGHGATAADSHHEVAMLHRSSAQLREVELPPFAAGIAAGTRAVMTGHLLLPALDADNIATVSRRITSTLLRGELGFGGTIVTDALEMRALAGTLGMERGFVAALAAGADAIETGAQDYPHLVTAIPRAVQRALDDGRLTAQRLREAGARTAELAVVRPAAATSSGQFGPEWAGTIAARCVEVVGRLPELRRPLVLEARPPAGMASGELPWSLGTALRRHVPDTATVEVHDAEQVAGALRDTGGRSVVAVVRDPLRHAWQNALAAAADVVVDVGWPAPLPDDVAIVRTRGIAPDLLAAVAALLAAVA